MKREATRLLFVITDLSPGGAEIQLLTFAAELVRRGWCVKVVSLLPGGSLRPRLEQAGVSVVSLGMTAGVASPLAVFRLSALVRQWKPDLVHSHLFHANVLSRVSRALWGRRPPLINSGHTVNEEKAGRYRAYRWTDCACDRFHAVAHCALDSYAERKATRRSKLFYVPSAVDASPRPRGGARARMGGPARFVFLSVGRLHRAKGHSDLIRAFARLHPTAHLVIAGSGPLAGMLSALARELGVSERVEFLGEHPTPRNLMREADALVIPSLWEATPIVLLEAAAEDLPVVATSVGDVPRIVADGVSGLLCQPGDVDGLARAMLRMRELAAQSRQAMAQALHTRVMPEFDLKRVTDAWEDIYRGLVVDALRLGDGRASKRSP